MEERVFDLGRIELDNWLYMVDEGNDDSCISDLADWWIIPRVNKITGR